MCILPFSCSLDEESRTEIDKNRFMKNALEAETVLLGVYQSLVSDAMYGYHLSILFNLATDCEQVEGSTTENYRIIGSSSNLVVISFLFHRSSSFLILLKVVDMFAF